MNILHVVDSIHPNGGGLPVVALSQAAAQAKLGHRVALLWRVGGGTVESERLLGSVPGIDKVTLVGCPRLTRQGALDALQLWRRGRTVDCVHLHGLWSPLVFLFANLAVLTRISYVITPHGMLAPNSLNIKTRKKRAALALGYQRILRKARFIHCLNTSEQAEVAGFGHTNTRVIPNGVFSELLGRLPAQGNVCQRFPQLGETPYVLFVGRLHAIKGVDRLLAAFYLVCQRSVGLNLVLCGPDEGTEQACRRQAAALGIADRVFFLGAVYDDAKYTLLVNAACFCLPSHQEGFSIAILEALACGVPVVISPECKFPEVEAAGAGWVTSAEPEPLAQILLSAARDPERMSIGARGQRLVIDHFTWEVVARQLVDAYSELDALRVKAGRASS